MIVKNDKQGLAPLVIILIIVGVLVVAGGVYWRQKNNINKLIFGEIPKACTQEAKLCPDGSSVGRTGPNCEFAECPDVTKDWKTYRNKEYRFEVKYPKEWFIEDNTVAGIVYFRNTDQEKTDYPVPLIIATIRTSAKSVFEFVNGSPEILFKKLKPNELKFKIDGSEVIKYSNTMAGCEEFFVFIGNGNLYEIIRGETTCDYNEMIFEQILSTFKFIK